MSHIHCAMRGRHGIDEILPVGICKCYDRALWLARNHIADALGTTGTLITETLALLVKRKATGAPRRVDACHASVHAGMRANLDMTASPDAHGNGRSVTAVENRQGHSDFDVPQAFCQVAILIVDVAQHVGVAVEVTAAKNNGFRGSNTLARTVIDVLGNSRNNATRVVLFQVLRVVGEEPHSTCVARILSHLVHDIIPGPSLTLHRRRTEDDGTSVEIETRGVHDHALVMGARTHM